MRTMTFLVASLALAACTPPGGKGGAAHPLERKVAPDVEVKMQGGAPFHPRDAVGKVLVLDYWATWCEPCKASFPKVDAIWKKHQSEGLMVVAVNEDDDAEGIPAFVKETGVGFPIARDESGKAATSFGVQTMPTSFVIDRRGVVRFVHSGYHPDDAAEIESEIQQLLQEPP